MHKYIFGSSKHIYFFFYNFVSCQCCSLKKSNHQKKKKQQNFSTTNSFIGMVCVYQKYAMNVPCAHYYNLQLFSNIMRKFSVFSGNLQCASRVWITHTKHDHHFHTQVFMQNRNKNNKNMNNIFSLLCIVLKREVQPGHS